MANLIARLTMAGGTKADKPVIYRESTAGDTQSITPPAGTDLVSVFANPKSLTFPVVVGLVKASWAGAESLPLSWVHSVWLPFFACVILGMIVTISNLRESAKRPEDWALGIFVGFLNCLLLFAAVLGVSPAAGTAR